MTRRINLDYYSGTPILPEVKQAMMAALEHTSNPSSIYGAGQRAKQMLDRSRGCLADLINASPGEIYFTSCGTESNNWALRGLMAAHRRRGNHIVISTIEHPSISLVARRLELDGAQITILPVDREAFVSAGDLSAALRPETALVSIMLANGEVGTIEPIRELAAIANEHGVLFHTDASAAIGHIEIDARDLGIDALTLAANQFYGPQGAGALFVKDGVRILPLLEGGGQEQGFRSGTEDVAAIVGMGVAAELAQKCLPERIERLGRLRDKLRDGLKERIENLRFNGSWSRRLPHNLHACVEGVSSESLILGLDQEGISVGLGSACNSKAMRPSHVLKAMGLSDERAEGALVLTIGALTTDEEIDRALEIIPAVVRRLRNVTALTHR